MIFFVLAYGLPNVILYGAAAWVLLRILRWLGIGQHRHPTKIWLMLCGGLLLLSTAAGSLYLRDWARASYRQSHEGGYHQYGTAPPPDRIAIEAGDARCPALCDELLARGLVRSVDMIDRSTGKIWRFQQISDAAACPTALGEFDPQYHKLSRATLQFPYYRAGLALNLCLSAEEIAHSDAPITVKSFDQSRNPKTDSTNHGYASKVWEFRRLEVWTTDGQNDPRLLASTEGAKIEIPFVPLLVTLPFETHGIGIPGYDGKGTHEVSYQDAKPWEVIGKSLGMPLTGQAPLPMASIALIVQNLSAASQTQDAAARTLRQMVIPDETGQAQIPPDPDWLAPIIAALSAPTPAKPVRLNLLRVLTAYGPAAAIAAPVIRQSFTDPGGDVLAAAITAASAIGLFTREDQPWLAAMTKFDWWETSKAAWAALKTLEAQN